MIKMSGRSLYVAAYAIGGLSTLVGAVTLVSDLQAAGIPSGGSVITLLVGVTILALAVTGPSTDADSDGTAPGDGPPDDGDGSRPESEEGPPRGAPADEGPS